MHTQRGGSPRTIRVRLVAMLLMIGAPIAGAVELIELTPEQLIEINGAPRVDEGPFPDSWTLLQRHELAVLEELDESSTRALRAQTCDLIGASTAAFPPTNTQRTRGNVYHFDQDRQLREILTELQFTTTGDIFFYVYVNTNGLADNSFTQVLEVQQNLTGTGAAFYSSGVISPPLNLSAGFDYFIGASWASSPAVAVRQDGGTYPGPFLAGTVVGWSFLNFRSPPLNPTENFSIFVTGGVFPQQLCFEAAPGACCPPSDVCTEVLQTNCENTLGGVFTAEGVTCADIGNACPLPVQACCLPDNSCAFVDEYTCGRLDPSAVPQPPGSVCVPNPCGPPLGACCFLDATCIETDSSDCGAQGGTYLGDFTACTSNGCGLPRGGCCFDTFCTTILTGAQCGAALGSYTSNGQECTPTNPCDVGACCVGANDELCVETSTFDCTNLGGVFSGSGSVCDPSPCLRGACCLGTECGEFTQDFCVNDLSGTFQGPDVACVELPCPQPTGACCNGAACSEGLTFDNCVASTGVYLGDGSTCLAGCGGSGGCCMSDGSCQVSSQTACDAAGGMYQGDFSDCTGTPPGGCEAFAACCLPDGTCRPLTQSVCTAIVGAVWNTNGVVDCAAAGCETIDGCCLGVACAEVTPTACTVAGGVQQGAVCTPDPCAGSCCFSDASCQVLTVDMCTNRPGLEIGSFSGTGTNCTPNQCSLPVGACCEPDGTCSEPTDEASCEAVFGIFLGDATTCGVGTCTPFGACCTDTGSCFDKVTQSDCDVLFSGFYQGDGSDCATAPCRPVGACCFPDGTCADFLEVACNATSNGVYQGPTTNCSSTTCPKIGACCREDGSCEIRSETSCINSNGAFQGAETDCASAPCGSGACCIAGEFCFEFTQAECLNPPFNGTFRGEGASCTPNPCSGACCLLDGTCTNGTPGDCASNGIYRGDGTDCATISPACEVRGACCNGGSCSEVTAADCSSNGGTYFGDGVPCTPGNPCLNGACCQADATCTQTDQTTCEGAQGAYSGNGTLCADVEPCPAMGACCFGPVCDVREQTSCSAAGGIYTGNGTTCGGGECPVTGPTGACCLGGAQPCLQNHTPTACSISGGFYNGDGSICPAQVGDFDGSGVLDPPDFVELEVCLDNSGPDGGPIGDCACWFDSDADGDVDLIDYGAFQLLMGP